MCHFYDNVIIKFDINGIKFKMRKQNKYIFFYVIKIGELLRLFKLS